MLVFLEIAFFYKSWKKSPSNVHSRCIWLLSCMLYRSPVWGPLSAVNKTGHCIDVFSQTTGQGAVRHQATWSFYSLMLVLLLCWSYIQPSITLTSLPKTESSQLRLLYFHITLNVSFYNNHNKGDITLTAVFILTTTEGFIETSCFCDRSTVSLEGIDERVLEMVLLQLTYCYFS